MKLKQRWNSVSLSCCGAYVTIQNIRMYLEVLQSQEGRDVRELERNLALQILEAFGQQLLIEQSIVAREHSKRIYLFNHTSYLDPFVLGAAIPDYIRGIGADYHFRWPWWGKLLYRRGIIPVNRHNHEQAMMAILAAELEILMAGDALVISPEGTRSPNGQLLPFKQGAFHAAKNTGASLVLVAITGAHESLPKGRLLVQPGTIRVQFEEWPAARFEHLSVNELREATRNRFLELLA